MIHFYCHCMARYENEKTIELCQKTKGELSKEFGFELKIKALTSNFGKLFQNFLQFNPNVVLF